MNVHGNGMIQSNPRPGPVSTYDLNAEPAGLDDTQINEVTSLNLVSPSERAIESDVKFNPWPIPESVYFLYKSVAATAGGQRRVPSATAFVLSVPSRNRRTITRFLVTARHVVDPQWANCPDRNPTSIEVRLNRRSGGIGYETIPLQSGRLRRHYFTPQDNTSDLAIILLDKVLIPNLELYKFVDTPFNLLPTETDLHSMASPQQDPAQDQPGHQVVTASLRTQNPGDLLAFPTLNFGVIASTTAEPVSIQCGKNLPARPLEVWLINAPIQQGVSGAPVYTSIQRSGHTMRTPILLGVQAIAWPDRGVAGITPSSVLADLVQTVLNGPIQNADFYRGVTAETHLAN